MDKVLEACCQSNMANVQMERQQKRKLGFFTYLSYNHYLSYTNKEM